MIKHRLCILLAAGLLYSSAAFASCNDYLTVDDVDMDQDQNTTWTVTLRSFDPTDGNIAHMISCLNSMPSVGMKSVRVRNPVDMTTREYNLWPLVLGDEADPDYCEECYDEFELMSD